MIGCCCHTPKLATAVIRAACMFFVLLRQALKAVAAWMAHTSKPVQKRLCVVGGQQQQQQREPSMLIAVSIAD